MRYIESCLDRTTKAVWRVVYVITISSLLCYVTWAFESGMPISEALFMLLMWAAVGIMWALTILLILATLSLGLDGS
jgi:hypothetical protein